MDKISFKVVLCCLLSLGMCYPQISNNVDKVNYENWQFPPVGYPLKYDMVLRTNSIRENFTYSGEVNITLRMRETSNTFWLHSKDLDLGSMELYESADDDNITNLDILVNLIHKPYDIVRLDLYTTEFKKFYLQSFKTYIVQIKFNGSIRNDSIGFIKIISKGKEYIPSDGWLFVNSPKSARALFPCFDETRYKAHFQLKVYHEPRTTVLSNVPAKHCPFERKRYVTCFATTPKLPAHMLGLVLLKNYAEVPIPMPGNKTMQQTFYATPYSNIKPMLAMIGASLVSIEKLDEYMNLKLGMPKLDHVIIYDLLPSVMETYGLIVHTESIFQENLPDLELDRIMLIFNSLTKVYLETLVTIPWQEQDTILEAVTSVLATRMMRQIPVAKEIKEFTQLKFCKKMSYFFDSKSIANKVQDSIPYKMFAGSGNCFMSMLEFLLGTESFDKTIDIYVKRNTATNVSHVTFAAAVEAAATTENGPLYWLVNINDVVKSWTGSENVPALNIAVDHERSVLYVRQLDVDFKPTANWTIPMRLSTVARKSNEFFIVHPGHLVTIFRPMHPNDCFYVDMEDNNMYHVFYDEPTLRCLGETLKTCPDCISPRNRAAILRSFFVLNFENDLNRMEAYLDLLKYLYREKHFYVWAIISQAWVMPGTKRGFGNKLVDAGFGHFYHYLLTSLDIENMGDYIDTSEVTTDGEFYLKKYVQHKFEDLRKILSQEKNNSIQALISKGDPTPESKEIEFNNRLLFQFCTELQEATYDELTSMFETLVERLDKEKVQMLAECSENPALMKDLNEKYGFYMPLPCGNETFITFSSICPRRSTEFYTNILSFVKPKTSDFDD